MIQPVAARRLRLVLPAFALALAACATGSGASVNQEVALNITREGKRVDAACTVQNEAGSWELFAPGRLSVTRSSSPLQISCRTANEGMARAEIQATGNRSGSWLRRGTRWSYPEEIEIPVGDGTTGSLGRPDTDSDSGTGTGGPTALGSASGFPVAGSNQVPYVDAAGLDGYQRFLNGAQPRAFAVSEAGHWARVNSASDAPRLALERCQAYGAVRCHLYAVDNTVVWRQPGSTARVAALSAPTGAGSGVPGGPLASQDGIHCTPRSVH